MEFPFHPEASEELVESLIREKTYGKAQQWLLDLFSRVRSARDYVEFSSFPNCYTLMLDGMKISVPSKKLNAAMRSDEDMIERDQIEQFAVCLELLYFYAFVKLVHLSPVKIWDEGVVSELTEIESRLM